MMKFGVWKIMVKQINDFTLHLLCKVELCVSLAESSLIRRLSWLISYNKEWCKTLKSKNNCFLLQIATQSAYISLNWRQWLDRRVFENLHLVCLGYRVALARVFLSAAVTRSVELLLVLSHSVASLVPQSDKTNVD